MASYASHFLQAFPALFRHPERTREGSNHERQGQILREYAQDDGVTNLAESATTSFVRRRHRHTGFTLIEVLVAGMILAISAAVMGTALSHAYASLSEARDERRAAILLDDLLTKIDMVGPARIADQGPRQGNFDGSDARFSWSVDIKSRPQGHLYDITATLSWASGKQNKSVQAHTYLNDAPNSRDATIRWRDL